MLSSRFAITSVMLRRLQPPDARHHPPPRIFLSRSMTGSVSAAGCMPSLGSGGFTWFSCGFYVLALRPNA